MRKFSNQQGPTPCQNITQWVRAHLGLTQDDLAMLLDVSRSAVALDERGDRRLPWSGVERLTKLRQVLPAPSTPAPPPPPPILSAADHDDLSFRRKLLQVEAYPLEQKLARCQVQLAQARCWQQVLPELRQLFPADDTSVHEWFDHFERRAASVLRKKAGSPALLQVRLAAIAFEQAEIDHLLAEAAPPEPVV